MQRIRLLSASTLAAIAIAMTACATIDTSSHVARNLDFTRYHSWRWTSPDTLPTTDARLDSPFFNDHFQGEVERQMTSHGLMQTHPDGAPPDLLVHYHANVSPKIAENHGDPTTGACYDEDCSVRVVENEVGTIVLDVIDARTHRLIWRGWAQTSAEGLLDQSKGLDHRIQKAVTGMFASFPRSTSTESHARADVPQTKRPAASANGAHR